MMEYKKTLKILVSLILLSPSLYSADNNPQPVQSSEVLDAQKILKSLIESVDKEKQSLNQQTTEESRNITQKKIEELTSQIYIYNLLLESFNFSQGSLENLKEEKDLIPALTTVNDLKSKLEGLPQNVEPQTFIKTVKTQVDQMRGKIYEKLEKISKEKSDLEKISKENSDKVDQQEYQIEALTSLINQPLKTPLQDETKKLIFQFAKNIAFLKDPSIPEKEDELKALLNNLKLIETQTSTLEGLQDFKLNQDKLNFLMNAIVMTKNNLKEKITKINEKLASITQNTKKPDVTITTPTNPSNSPTTNSTTPASQTKTNDQTQAAAISTQNTASNSQASSSTAQATSANPTTTPVTTTSQPKVDDAVQALRAKQSEYLSGITTYETSLNNKNLTTEEQSNINWMNGKFNNQLTQVNNELKKAGFIEEYPFSQKINTPVMLLTVENSFTKGLKIATELEINELIQKNSELPKQQQLPLDLHVGQLIVAPDELDLTSVFFIAPIQNQTYYGLVAQIPDPVTGKMALRPIYWDSNKKIMFISQEVIGRDEDQKIKLQNDDNLVKLDFVKIGNKEIFCLKKAGNLVDQTDTSSGTGYFGFKSQVDNLGLLFDRDPVASVYRGISQDEAAKFIIKKIATPDVLDYFVPASLNDFTKDDFRDLLKTVMQLLNLAYYNNLGQFHNNLLLGLRDYLCNPRGEAVFPEDKMISFLGVKMNPSDSTPWMEMILTNLQGKAEAGQSWGFQFSKQAQDAINLLFKVYVSDAKNTAILKIQEARKQSVDKKLEALKTKANFDNFITLFKALANPDGWFDSSSSAEDVSPASNDTLKKSLMDLEAGITLLKDFVKKKIETEIKTTEDWNKYSEDFSSAKDLQQLIGLMFANQFPQLLLKKAYQSFELMNNPETIAAALSKESTFNEQIIKALSKRLIDLRDFSNNQDLLNLIKSRGFDLVSLYNDLKKVLSKQPPAKAVVAKPAKPKKAAKFNMIDITALNTANPLQNTIAAATLTDPNATAPVVGQENSSQSSQESSVQTAAPVDISGF